jgi:glutamyl-tRNA synthetase
LANAAKFGGKARAEAVLGRLMSETRGAVQAEDTKKITEETVALVNNMPQEDQVKELSKLAPELLEQRKKEREIKELPALPNIDMYSKIVMRLAPYPSGPLHIGNARMAILNDEYVKRYRGELILAYDDTIGSVEKDIVPEAYDLIKDGLDWLGVDIDKIVYKSDRISIFYEWARILLERDLAYVCECKAETLRRNRLLGDECSCRDSSKDSNLDRWDKMLGGFYDEGEAVVRLKTDMKHPNPAFRDRVLLRVSRRVHPRVGDRYIVWPMLEFSWAIDDHLLGITHILRGKDLVIEDMMEIFLWNLFGWRSPEIMHHGLLQISGTKLSKTKSRAMIDKKIYSGWDDPQTWSMQSLRRRGIRPEALREFVLEFGLSLSEVTVPLDNLYTLDKKILDPLSDRYVFVSDPVNLTIVNMPGKIENNIPRHPDFPARGFKRFSIVPEPDKSVTLLVSRDDLKLLGVSKYVRLINLCNLRVTKLSESGAQCVYYSADHRDAKSLDAPLLQWLQLDDIFPARVFMPDGTTKEGVAELQCTKLDVGTIIQFIRFGFVRIDKKNLEIDAFFSHN